MSSPNVARTVEPLRNVTTDRAVRQKMSAPPVQHLVARQRRLSLPWIRGSAPSSTSVEGVAETICDLRWHETVRQPAPDRRTALDRFARDERLKQGADACARAVAVATFLDRPLTTDDADRRHTPRP